MSMKVNEQKGEDATLDAGCERTSARKHSSQHVRVEQANAQRPEDALALIEEYYDAIEVVERDDRDALLEYLSNPQSAVWVAYYGTVPAGCILYRPLPAMDRAGEIKRLYVRSAYRGCGVASQLLRTLEEFATGQSARWLYLDTKDDLHEAIAFYDHHGYTSCARYNENPQATIFMRKELPPPVTVRSFQQGDEDAFRRLNEAWISKYFRLEEKDRQSLNDPHTYILSPGGQILMALRGRQPVGCCALYARDDGSYELAKMAVAEQQRGQGIGRQLIEHAIAYARGHQIPRLYLETNSSLTNAIHLYESVGFCHVPPERIEPSPFARADVYMEMFLS
jgi:putative acetyltransferase